MMHVLKQFPQTAMLKQKWTLASSQAPAGTSPPCKEGFSPADTKEMKLAEAASKGANDKRLRKPTGRLKGKEGLACTLSCLGANAALAGHSKSVR